MSILDNFDPFKSTIDEAPEEEIKALAELNSESYYTIRVGGKDTHQLCKGLHTAIRVANGLALRYSTQLGIKYFHEWQPGKEKGNHTKRAKGKANTHSYSIHLIWLGTPSEEDLPTNVVDLSSLNIATKDGLPIIKATADQLTSEDESDDVRRYMAKHNITYIEEYDTLSSTARNAADLYLGDYSVDRNTMDGIRFLHNEMVQKKASLKFREEVEEAEAKIKKQEDKFK